MTGSSSPTPFPLGVYLENPDYTSLENQSLFNRNYSAFTALMGASPQFLTTFVDQTQPIIDWIGNSTWAATSMADTPSLAGTTPVIAIPLASTATGSATPDQQYQAFAAGKYDSTLTGIVNTWAQEGFKNLVIRPGWEMNLVGSNYAGDSAQSQADWVAAYQHAYTVLHQAAAADGVNVTVVWNPGVTNYSNAEATTALYPGNAYVDAIGADIYSDIFPYSDSPTATEYHDWDTGKEDSSVAQFIADPVNRDHYWTYPAATQWSNDGSGGHSLSLDNLIQFAEAEGKPFVIPETGAGNSSDGTDVDDDAAFPQWLAQQLTTAQAAGAKIGFVDLWDSNGGGNYEFSNASDGKPLEAAAWAQYFGAIATTTPVQTVAPPAPSTVTLGSGPATLAIVVSEDAWQGNAEFTISIDGTQIGGTQTTTAIESAGQTQTFDVAGNFGTGVHTASVDFINDAYGGTAATDRNLYVDSATLDGTAVSGAALVLYGNGSQSFSFGSAVAGADTIDLHVSEDAWQGNAEFTVEIDGKTLSGIYTATASHAAGATQDVAISGDWGGGSHTIGVSFINDAWGGSASTDRNLYVDQVSYDGHLASGAPATLLNDSTANFNVAGGTSTPTTLSLQLAEDAYNGDAAYAIAVDGTTLTTGNTVTALHALGQSQTVSLQDMLSAGTHDLAISFLNDAWGGTAQTDRNLYVDGIEVNGTAVSGGSATLLNTSTDHFQIVVPAG